MSLIAKQLQFTMAESESKGEEMSLLCEGRVFEFVQLSHIFKDVKHFVDMSVKNDEISILKEFDKLTNNGDIKHIGMMNESQKEEFGKFMEKNFDEPGKELKATVPNDWKDWKQLTDNGTKNINQIPLLSKIENKDLQKFAIDLNHLWKELARSYCPTKNEQNKNNIGTFIDLNKQNQDAFMVAGGRFREVYYWDTFWIIKGLLACHMIKTAQNIINNVFIPLIDKYGFIPNGTRIYYTHRSQPPLFACMINEIVIYLMNNKLEYIEWLTNVLPYLDKEYHFWTNSPIKVANIELARYFTKETSCRPEGYWHDLDLINKNDRNKQRKEIICQNIRATAMSGWDFSSRFCYTNDESKDNTDLTNLDTCDVIPVDLNVFLCKMEGYCAKFYQIIGKANENNENEKKKCEKMSQEYKANQINRMQNMIDVLYDRKNGIFRDYNFALKQFGPLHVPSNYFVLWSNDFVEYCLKSNNINIETMVDSLIKSGLICKGGIVTSLIESGQQWDFPNCWPPINHILIDSLHNVSNILAQCDSKLDALSNKCAKLAFDLAQTWMTNNFHTFVKTKFMHEKYDCKAYGRPGGGGEYEPQIGFGWTNGTIFALLEMFGNNLSLHKPNAHL